MASDRNILSILELEHVLECNIAYGQPSSIKHKKALCNITYEKLTVPSSLFSMFIPASMALISEVPPSLSGILRILFITECSVYNAAKNNEDLVNTAYYCVEIQLQNIYYLTLKHENIPEYCPQAKKIN